MTSMVSSYLLAVALALQAAGALPIQIGPTGSRLTADDVRQITRISSDAGSAPWLMVGQAPSGIMHTPHPWPVAVFLAPDHSTATVRRGRLLYVQAGLATLDDYSAPKHWTVFSSGQWAQVPSDAASSSRVRDSRDLNRPFALVGPFDDQTIYDVVATIREANPKTTGVQVVWPILTMNRDSESKVSVHLVGLNRDELSGQVVILERSSTGWRITGVAGWAV